MDTFESILSRYGVHFETEGRYCRPGWVQFQCPFCFGGKDPNKPYAGFNTYGGYVNCWRCGSHNPTKTVSLLCSIPYKTAAKLLGTIERPHETPEEDVGTLVLPRGIGNLVAAHRNYLSARGFSWKKLETLWGIQGTTMSTRLPWRIFIPVHYRGRVVSWTTRRITDKEPRYISAGKQEEEIPHKKLLYGEDYVRGRSIIVHEGPTDVWRTGPGAVGLLGTGFTRSQILKLVQYSRRIICFDSQVEAIMRARKLCDLLDPYPGETMLVTLDAPDPASASHQEIRRLRRLL